MKASVNIYVLNILSSSSLHLLLPEDKLEHELNCFNNIIGDFFQFFSCGFNPEVDVGGWWRMVGDRQWLVDN